MSRRKFFRGKFSFVEVQRHNASRIRRNLRGQTGTPEKILYRPAGRQGVNLNFSLHRRQDLNSSGSVQCNDDKKEDYPPEKRGGLKGKKTSKRY